LLCCSFHNMPFLALNFVDFPCNSASTSCLFIRPYLYYVILARYPFLSLVSFIVSFASLVVPSSANLLSYNI
jgi:hypothetical protein